MEHIEVGAYKKARVKDIFEIIYQLHPIFEISLKKIGVSDFYYFYCAPQLTKSIEAHLYTQKYIYMSKKIQKLNMALVTALIKLIIIALISLVAC